MKNKANQAKDNKLSVIKRDAPKELSETKKDTPKISSETKKDTPKVLSDDKPKKKPVIKAVIAAAAVIIVGGVILGVLYFKNPDNNPVEKVFEAQIEVSMADGTVQTMNANAAYAEIATDKFYAGTVIDGVEVGGMTKQEAYDAVMKVLPENPVDIDVKLNLEGRPLNLKFNNVIVEYNTAEIIDEAFAKYRPVDKTDLTNLAECYNGVQKLKNEKLTYESTYTVKIGDVKETVSKVLGLYVEEYSTVKNATIVDFDTETCEFVVEKEKPGYAIDIDGTAKAVEDLFNSGKYTGTIDVLTVVTQPEITEEMIREEFGLVGYEWTITDGNDNRNNNISQACDNINGTILEPGEVFSFNEVVGQRTYDNGFLPATVIAGGEYKQDLGGGICQVSSTLYNAVLMSDLEIVERHPHAWPSEYVDPGLDATVDWPALDFKFRNDSDFQIVIVTWWDSSDSSCNAQIYGKKLPDGQYIETHGEIVSTTAAGDTEYVADPDMPVGQTKTLRNAHQGVSAYAYKIWYDKDGNEISYDYYNSSYYGSYGARIAVGVLRSDGSIATLDTSTGEVIDPDPPTPTPDPTTPTPDPTTPAPTQPTETSAETTPSETPSETTTPATPDPATPDTGTTP